MHAPPHDSWKSDNAAQAAAGWLARRDRGLTAAEQDDYFHWLRQDPCHGRAVAAMEKTWQSLDALTEWRPAHSVEPNPDLLAWPQARHWMRSWFAGLALAAAAVAIGFFVVQAERRGDGLVARGVRVIPRPERLVLADGSVVELNHGGKIETDFTPAERRVRLLRGEAHFTVAKNPARPFVVDAGAVAVRAVGTAFEVRRATAEVEVLVTEGKVHVERPTLATTSLIAGERTVVDTSVPAGPAVVTAVTPAEVERALAWQGVRLEFAALPLAEVVAEFNLRNATQVVIADADTAQLRVGGTFRADNIEGFVRLLQSTFGVTVDRRPDGTMILRYAK